MNLTAIAFLFERFYEYVQLPSIANNFDITDLTDIIKKTQSIDMFETYGNSYPDVGSNFESACSNIQNYTYVLCFTTVSDEYLSIIESHNNSSDYESIILGNDLVKLLPRPKRQGFSNQFINKQRVVDSSFHEHIRLTCFFIQT